ncbi:hypothetical protein FM042_06740 [Aliidiomarina halalkaliphila]|uniref:Uncharacterized protein n=1 Tax=Aliidiomarina halalkaliphila TaxID=2593535 RepID=A0A552X0V9_9GAMM|nr:hypothetical protein [Aliidiomarina halalkaliphila]TRW48677.1 hypothetical protein FM042_06740 [Aliidiomarina halalkaliphila]
MTQQEKSSESQIPKSGYTVSSGGNVYFDVDGHQVRIWFSGWNVGERVYVDDVEVSQLRSWRFVSSHDFTIDGTAYKLELGIKGWRNLLKGVYFARLYRGDTLIDQDWVRAYEGANKPFSWKTFLLLVFVGAGVGYVVGGQVARWLG